jgi:hypothetical protein
VQPHAIPVRVIALRRPLRRRQWPKIALIAAKQLYYRRAELILLRASGIGLIISLLLNSQPYPRAARKIAEAYTFRFCRPATFGDIFDTVMAIVIWPFAVLSCTTWFTFKNGAVIAERFGRSRIRQFADQLRLAVTSGLAPPWYYVFELYRPGEMRKAPAFLTRAETKQGSNRLLAKALGPSSPLDDKEKFARHCARCGVDAVPTLFSVRDGEFNGIARADELPKADLFVKPVLGRGGRGAERWDYAGKGLYRHPDGRVLRATGLLTRLRHLSNWQPMLVQQRMRNHPAIADLSNGALNTLRIISCLDERNEPELIGGVLRMAVGRNVTVDNVHAGGIAAAVDPELGLLRQATYAGFDARRGWTDWHPSTGALITGRMLPMWDSVRELVLKAHHAFNDWVVIGWDVAILSERACLVEGNCGPDVDLIQRPLRTPFGSSRLGELIAFHLERTKTRWQGSYHLR